MKDVSSFDGFTDKTKVMNRNNRLFGKIIDIFNDFFISRINAVALLTTVIIFFAVTHSYPTDQFGNKVLIMTVLVHFSIATILKTLLVFTIYEGSPIKWLQSSNSGQTYFYRLIVNFLSKIFGINMLLLSTTISIFFMCYIAPIVYYTSQKQPIRILMKLFAKSLFLSWLGQYWVSIVMADEEPYFSYFNDLPVSEL